MKDYEDLSKAFVSFIDLLYAVVAGFAIDRYFRHIIEQSRELHALLSAVGTQEFGLFLLAFFVVGRDWINYHSLVKGRPHKSLWRFIIDILILFTFVAMLQKINSTLFFLEILIFYWVLLTIWSIVECIEYYREADKNKGCRQAIVEDAVLLVLTIAFFFFVRNLLPSFRSSIFIPYIVILLTIFIPTLIKKICK